MGGKGAVKNPNARAIITQTQREKREAERVLKQLLKLSSSNTTEKLQKLVERILEVLRNGKWSPKLKAELKSTLKQPICFLILYIMVFDRDKSHSI